MAEFPHILSKNALEDATVTFADGDGNSLTEDDLYRLVYLADRSRLSKFHGVSGVAAQTISWTFTAAQIASGGIAYNTNTFVLDKGFVLTGGSAAVYLDYSADGSSWTNAITLSSVDTDVIYWRALSAAVSRRYWRLRITGLTAAPQIFNVWLGARIELLKGVTGGFDPNEEEEVGEAVIGASGGMHYTHRYNRKVQRIPFTQLNDTDYALLETYWAQAGKLGKNWWWLLYPTTRAANPTLSKYYPIYLNSGRSSFKFDLNPTVRSGMIEAFEVK